MRKPSSAQLPRLLARQHCERYIRCQLDLDTY
jgi:hypothetical protein